MRRLWIVLAVLVLAVGLTVFFIPPLKFWVVGKVSGEPQANGMPASYWVHAVRQHDTADQRATAANTLAELGPNTPGAVDALRDALTDPDPYVRTAAAAGLGRVATADQAGDALQNALADSDGPTRAAAAGSLGQLLPAKPGTIEALHKMAKSDGFVQARIAAIMALGNYGELAAAATPTLVEALKESDTPNGSPHEAAVYALSRLCKDRLPVLLTALERKETRLQMGVLKTLPMIGSAAAAAVPDVLKMTSTADAVIQLEAAQALWRIEQKAERPLAVARQHLRSDEKNDRQRVTIRTKALYLLGELGGSADAVVPDVIALLKEDPETAIRRYAAMSLGKFGKTPAIVEALQVAAKTDKDPDVCAAANEQLKNLGLK